MNGLVLFDIDNTLLYTGGAGTAALNLAFAEVYAIDDAFAQIEFHGRTDITIMRDAIRLHNIASGGVEHDVSELIAAYLHSLDRLLVEREGHLKPGIPLILDALLDAGMTLGLATGNLREGALRKLRYYDIDSYFALGGFGDIAEDRGTMVRDAVAACGMSDGGCPVLIIGDTPGDVAGAKANGAVAVGVATGAYSVDDLAAAGADLTFDDLGDVERVVSELSTMAARANLTPQLPRSPSPSMTDGEGARG